MTGAASFWSGPAAARFRGAEVGEDTTALLALAAPAAGEHVVDVGCGRGATAQLLAERVGPRGSVLGIDISQEMLAAARTRAPGVELVCADAATHPFAADHFQLVFSRFGVMFFADPGAAFAGFHRALAPGGRLAFSCYGPYQDASWLGIVLRAAREVAPAWHPPHADARPGPFAFADRDRVAAVIDGAGFADLEIAPHHGVEPLGATLAESVEQLFARPFVTWFLTTLPAAARAKVRTRARRVIEAFATDAGYAMPTEMWMVTARKPARRARAAPARRPGASRRRRARRSAPRTSRRSACA